MEIDQQSVQEFVNRAEKSDVEIDELFQFAQRLLENTTERKNIHTFLDVGHFPAVNTLIANERRVDEWLNLLRQLILESQYTVGHLVYKRYLKYRHRTLFQKFQGNELISYTFKDIWEMLVKIASSLERERCENPHLKIGILTPNTLKGALVDLSCLSFHFPVVPIPANAPDNDIDFIIRHSQLTHIFVGGKKCNHWKDAVLSHHEGLIVTDVESSYWDSFIMSGKKIDSMSVLKRMSRGKMDSIATVMYTSGTTGEPKGIIFTQENMITKRFARALALPELGPKDSFLCYLPLFHTFGRFFELQGSVFWGATYTFAENTSFDSLLTNFKIVKPSVFISIPKRWTQLYELIGDTAGENIENDTITKDVMKGLTGGRLKWGLSAAGYLDPDIFRFFQTNGVNVLSGYGMTEATGGITMTPPHDYIEDSVGKALPGIELTLADDGELLMRGSYVIDSYFGTPPTPAAQDGWFHSGDIFTKKNEHYFIRDRKKEIYKNAAGQTISPQKIENMLQEFDAIQSAFLIGDRKNYNTVLIYPDPDFLNAHIPNSEPDKIRESMRALVQSVNGFLSPYERIANFAAIHRDFDAEHNERTQKRTFRRKNILDNWENIIESLYESNQAKLHHKERTITIDNWFLKEMNHVPNDFDWNGEQLIIESKNIRCTFEWNDDKITLGQFEYCTKEKEIYLETFLLDPRLWLGNIEFVEFVKPVIFQLKHFQNSENTTLYKRGFFGKIEPEHIKAIIGKSSTLEQLHSGAILLMQKNISGLNYFNDVFQSNDVELKDIALDFLISVANDQHLELAGSIHDFILPFLDQQSYIPFLKNLFYQHRKNNNEGSWKIDIDSMEEKHVHAILHELYSLRKTDQNLNNGDMSYIKMLMDICATVIHSRPSQYAIIRHELKSWSMCVNNHILSDYAQKCVAKLFDHFRILIRKSDEIAAFSSGKVNWKDIIHFDTSVSEPHQKLFFEILRSHTIVRECIFILTGNMKIQLQDIKTRGLWVTRHRTSENFIQYRVLITLKDNRVFNFIISHFPNASEEEIMKIRDWQIVMGSGLETENITENFISSWPNHKIIISEFDPTGDVLSILKTHSDDIANPSLRDRWDMRWLHLGWSSLQAYIDYWARTNYHFTLINPSVHNVSVSEYDYSSSVRIKGAFFFEEHSSYSTFFSQLYNELIQNTELFIPGLNHVIDWEVLFTCVISSAGEKMGLDLLKKFAQEIEELTETEYGLTFERVQEFIHDTQTVGYLPKPLVFAALRFQRWIDLNPNAGLQSQSKILQELYNDYNLNDLYADRPEIRVRYFLMTCFKHNEFYVAKQLFSLAKGLHNKTIEPEKLEAKIHAISNNNQCSEDESFFLTRLIYEHIDSADYAELITSTSDEGKIELVVQVKNNMNELFSIRPPFKPKELAGLHDILLANNLPANFTDEHKFLLIFSSNNHLAGGIYWKPEKNKTVHLEKIAIQKQFQKKGLGFLLLNEVFQRIKKDGTTHATTGFLRADFFQHHGFVTDEGFSGLVKKL